MRKQIRENQVIGLTISGILGSAALCPAAVTMTFTESGSDVILSITGSVNTSGLTTLPATTLNVSGLISNTNGNWVFVNGMNGVNMVPVQVWSTTLLSSNPISITGHNFNLVNSSGSAFGTQLNNGIIYLPSSYASGSAISSTGAWASKSFSTLGLTPGTYTYTWGSGATADSLTLAVVPEPSAALLGVLGVLTLLRRRRREVV